jgi:putative lipoic acid-binding regulatory protein
VLSFFTQQRNEMIAHLKDQLQEMKAKASMEGKYIRKDAEVRVNVTQKKCQQIETSLRQELEVRNCVKLTHKNLVALTL